MLKKYKALFHPRTVFIASLLALGLSLILFIHWNVTLSKNLEFFTTRFNLDQRLISDGPRSGVMVVITSILIGFIMAGMALMFIYYQKINKLYVMQDNFINTMTHELKTPLASINLYLETFQKHQLSPSEQQEFIQCMLKDTNRLSGHVAQILQVARLENKHGAYALERQDLGIFIQQFIEQNSYLFPQGKIDLINLLPSGPFLEFNPLLMETLLMNLATNAMKYNIQSEKKLSIKLALKRATLQMVFEDNGIGIEKKYQKKIFKKFFRIESDSAHYPKVKGSGLGLYLVSQIVYVHKGHIVAENVNEDESGSRFIFSFPKTQTLNFALKRGS